MIFQITDFIRLFLVVAFNFIFKILDFNKIELRFNSWFMLYFKSILLKQHINILLIALKLFGIYIKFIIKVELLFNRLYTFLMLYLSSKQAKVNGSQRGGDKR